MPKMFVSANVFSIRLCRKLHTVLFCRNAWLGTPYFSQGCMSQCSKSITNSWGTYIKLRNVSIDLKR